MAPEKILNDPIHKMINLHPLWVKIINTPEFQRLHFLKQLGCAFFVYPSATHTRFEHSIGVCYLADRMIRNLWNSLSKRKDRKPIATITEEDCLCVSIAGLCHDLGHGAFSHDWQTFMKRKFQKDKINKKWQHEEMSIKIFDRIWDKLNEDNVWSSYNLTEDHHKLICRLIHREDLDVMDPEKRFLYQIVANHDNGVDVDKWDYLCRDSYYLGLLEVVPFQFNRLLKLAQLELDENKRESEQKDVVISYKDSERLNIYQMFYTRWLLYRKAYSHRVTRIVTRMMVDAFLEADSDQIYTNGKKLSELSEDLDSYMKLNDSIIHWLKELDKDHAARKLIEKVEKRDLDKCVGCCFYPIKAENAVASGTKEESETELEKEIEAFVEKSTNVKGGYYIDVVKFDYGMNTKNPLEHIQFHSRYQTPSGRQPSRMMPNEFKEYQIMCLIRNGNEEEREAVQCAFKEWFDEHKEKRELFDFTTPI